MENNLNEQILDEFLNIYFLRPENAFMTYRRAISIYESGFKFEGKSLDISCGDGLFSFITAGGKLNKEFDMFINIDPQKIFELCDDKSTDIFDSYKKNYDINYEKIVIKKPDYKITYGTDWKQSLLDKAKILGLYENLLLHDNNKPFPFEDEYFDRVYSNSIYWIENINLHIDEIARITKRGGEVLLQIKTNELINLHPINWNIEWLSKESLEILDRGRLATWHSIKPIEWYIKQFENRGFEVKKILPTYSREQVMIWHIGLRPIAHFMIYLFNRLPLNERTLVKEKFIEYIKPLVRDVAKIKPKNNDGYEFTIRLVKKE